MFLTWESAMRECLRRRAANQKAVVRKRPWFGWKVIEPTVPVRYDSGDTNPKDLLTVKKLKKLVDKEMRWLRRGGFL